MVTDPSPGCPYCQAKMVRWGTPPGTSWSTTHQYVCFNDACPYYVRGWAWMRERYNVHASYRHRLDPVTHESGPLPVWSASALRNMIVPPEGPPDGV